jgi:predicted GNAT family acetyltransferase
VAGEPRASNDPAIEIVALPERRRFEIRVDGATAGHSEYVRKGGRVIFTHTRIDEAYGGRGLGSKLVGGALDAVRAAGDPVVPLCPFVAEYIERHPEYDELVDHECLAYLEQRAERRSA